MQIVKSPIRHRTLRGNPKPIAQHCSIANFEKSYETLFVCFFVWAVCFYTWEHSILQITCYIRILHAAYELEINSCSTGTR